MWGKWYARFCSVVVAAALGLGSASADVLCKVQFQNISNSIQKRVVISFSEPVNGFSQSKMKFANSTLESFSSRSLSGHRAKSQAATSKFQAVIRPIIPSGSSKVKVTVRVPESVVRGISRSDNARCEGSLVVNQIAGPTPTKTSSPGKDQPATATRTPTKAATATNSPLPTATRTPAPTATHTAAPSATFTSVSATSTPVSTATPSPVIPTATATRTPTASIAPTRTATPVVTSTPTRQATSTPVSPGSACSSSAEISVASVPAFPSAEGHGRLSFGGSGRHLSNPCTTIHYVTNLKDSGAGSLRSCIEANGPRTCVFNVGGPIWSTKELVIKNPFITIAGQTAPAPGIMIRGSGISIQASNVILQHLQLRVGDDPRESCCASQSCSAAAAQFCTADPGSRDGIRIYSNASAINNIIIDHVSIAWALDEGFSITPDKGVISNVTFSNSIIASGLDMSIHPEASIPTDPGHSKGVLMNGSSSISKLSFIKNLLAHNADRNIRISTPISMEYINNVIYDWGRGRGAGRTIELTNSVTATHYIDLISNLYLPGLDTFCPGTQYRPELCSDHANGVDTPEQQLKMHYILRVGGGLSNGLSMASRYYLRENLGTTRPTPDMDDWAAADKSFFVNSSSLSLLYPSNRASGPVAASDTVSIVGIPNLLGTVLTHAGSRNLDRDSVDASTISDVQLRQGRIINCVQADGSARCAKNAGGWPYYPATERQFFVPANPNSDDDADGYTNLEEALFNASAQVQAQ